MEENTLKINNLEINCKSLIEFSSLITVLLELTKKQKETEKKLGEYDIKLNNMIKLISTIQKEQKEQKELKEPKEIRIGWQDKENELSNILNDEHIFSMNYNNSNLSNYINNEVLNEAPKQNNKNINNNDNIIIQEKEDKNIPEKEEIISQKEKEKEITVINIPQKNNKEINVDIEKDDKQIINTNQNEEIKSNENQNLKEKQKEKEKDEGTNMVINTNINNNIITTSEKKPQEESIPVQKHIDKSNKNTEIISKMFQRIVLLEKKVAELISKSGENIIIRALNTNKQSINDHSDSIKKLKEVTEKINKEITELKEKMQDFNIYDMFNDVGDGNIDITKSLLKALETKQNKRFDLFEEKYKLISAENFKNKDDIKNQRIIIDGQKLLIEKNTEKISELIKEQKEKENLQKEIKEKENDDLNQKLEDINKNIEIIGENYDNKLIELENKLSQQQKQPILVTDLKPENKKDKKENENSILLREHNGRILDLEKSMRQLLKKLNIEEINNNLSILQKEVSKKGNQGAIEEIVDRLYNMDETIKQLSFRVDSSQALEKKNMEENSNLSKKFETFANQVNRLSFQLAKNQKEEKTDIDLSKFIEIRSFEENKKEVNKKFDKIRISFEDILKHIDEILDKLSHTPTDKDFAQYQEVIKSMLDEYRINNNKKYADKYDTSKNFKFLETQIKTVNENYNKKMEGQDNWLLAKKPLNNYLCASCEGIIRGELDKRCDYIPWNKYPNREEKYTRMGHGFSHMLQMVNDDIRKNVDNKEKEKEKDYNSDEDKKKNSKDKNNSAIKLPKVKIRPRYFNNINLMEDTTWEKSPYDNTDRNLTLNDNSPQIMKISRIRKNISIKNNSTQEASINDDNSNKGKNNLNIKTFPNESSLLEKKQGESE